MKIQCNVCEVAEATVLCCADEAALCSSCDQKVHAANKLATKHQRVSLTGSSSAMPKCDICQETAGYFFCLEDRALLCQKCDVKIHSANNLVSAHRRFLLTGVKVGGEPSELVVSSSSAKFHSGRILSEEEACTPSANRSQELLSDGYNNMLVQVDGAEDLPPSSLPFSGGSAAGSSPQWQFDDYLDLCEFDNSYANIENAACKADSGKLGSFCCSLSYEAEEEMNSDECLGRVPDASWMVPQVPSPPTYSGLFWPRNDQCLSGFVPDVCSSAVQSPTYLDGSSTRSSKRRRGLYPSS